MFGMWKDHGGERLAQAVPRILWAEDSDHDRMFIQAILGQLPSRPATEFVADGEELLERIDEATPDLVVLDLQLPNVGGLEVLSRLQGRPTRPRVVVFSGLESAAMVSACRGLGAADYVVKPVDFRQFRQTVERIVGSVSGQATSNGLSEGLVPA